MLSILIHGGETLGVLECVAIPERYMNEIQQSTSFQRPPEHVWTYITNIEGKGSPIYYEE